MTDERLDAIFGSLEQTATPEPGFADRLFGDLVVEAGLRPATTRWHPAAPPRGLARRSGVATTRLAAATLAVVALGTVLWIGLAAVGAPSVGPLATSTPVPTSAASGVATPTPGATIAVPRPGSTALHVGERPPVWTSSDKTFSTADLGGKPTAIYVWCACIWGPQPETFFAEAAARGPAMNLIFVSIESKGVTSGLVDWLHVRSPVVDDPRATILERWGLDSPALVFLRADGTFADVHPSTFTAETLATSLDALANGQPIPAPAGAPGPPLDAQGRLLLTSVLQVGQPAPELRGPKLGGGEASTSDFRGKRTAVVSWLPPHADGTPQDDLSDASALLAAARRHQGELNVLLIAAGEPETGAVAAYLRAHGSDVPVIFDWDGALKARWGLVMATTIVLIDADGRVAGYAGPQTVIAPDRLLDAFVAGDPLPTPGVAAP